MTITDTHAQAVEFVPPLLVPSPHGLLAATAFENNGPARFMLGVRFWPHNFAAQAGFGSARLASWCDTPDKPAGDREAPGDPFDPVALWAADQCDMTAASQAETRDNVTQTLRLKESKTLEEALAQRLLDDAAGAPSYSGALVDAVGFLDAAIQNEGFAGGYIHTAPALAAVAAHALVAARNGTRWHTPLDNVYVFGAGYTDTLEHTLIATTPTYGWATPINTYETLSPANNEHYAVAEKAILVGYERLIAAATVED